MKKILFDLLSAQPAGSSKFHGGGEYIKTVFRYFVLESGVNCDLAVFYDESKFLDEWIINIILVNNIRTINVNNGADIASILKNESFDIVYSGLPYYFRREYFPENIVVKGTIHGLRTIEMPVEKYTHCFYKGLIKTKLFVKDFLWRNTSYDPRKKVIDSSKEYILSLDEFICDSMYTKYSIMQSFPSVANDQVEVLYAPMKYEELSADTTIDLPEGKYILMIGGNRWEKNVYRAIQALLNLEEKKLLAGYTVCIVGELPKSQKKWVEGNSLFIQFNYLSPEDLDLLYKNCDIFLYPTINEGFGLPPIEAMRYSKTCIVSSVCSLPEIYGESVYWVNPYDIYEIENRILQAIYNPISPRLIDEKVKSIINRQQMDIQKICEFIAK